MILRSRWMGLLYAAFICSSLQATTVIVGQPVLTGTGNCDPFGCASFFGLGTYQQVYASSAFAAPLNISSLIFYNSQVTTNGRPDQGTYTLSLSYTAKAPGMLDLTNPANNIGSNSQTFYTGTLPAPVGPTNSRTITFSGTAYAYDPANGNLLLTIVVSTPVDQSPPLYLDEAASTAVTTNAYFGTTSGGPVSGGNNIGGLVTGFASLLITGPSSLAAGVVGVSYGPVTFTATGGSGSFTWSATGLPNGLTFSSGGVLSGTPAAASQGSYNPQFTVTDSSSDTASLTLPLSIDAAGLSITGPTSLAAGTVGAAYGPVTFTASGGSGGYTWSATGLPNGLSISAAGVLSGTPASGSQGNYNPQFTVMDSTHSTANVTLPLVINTATLTITGPTSLSAGTVGVAYGPVTFTASGGSGGYSWTATGLPSGLSISTAGVLSGTPASGSQGSYNPQFTVTDSNHNTANVTLPLVISAASLTITGPSSLSAGTVGVAYGPVAFTASGGSGGYTWTATGLPNGLSISGAGVLSGTPATGSQGNYNPQFTVMDSNHSTANMTLPLVINTASLMVTGPSSLPSGAVGAAYGPVTFTASGGGGSYTWSSTTLPSGLIFSAAGVLSGTPAAGTQGNYNPQFTVTDSNRNTANVTLALVISSPAGSFAITSSPKSVQVTPGAPATYTITTTVHNGFNSAISLSASGQPAGATVSFNPSIISAPGAGSSTMTVSTSTSVPNGQYTITVTGTGGGSVDTTNVVLRVATPNFSITLRPKSVSIPPGSSTMITVTSALFDGFDAAISLSASGQPSGATITFNPSTIPAPGAGSATMTVSVASTAASGTYTVTVTGTGGGITQTNNLHVTIPTFSITSSPRSVKVAPGASTNITINTAVFGGFNAAISLSASGQPAGATVSFNPNTIPAPGAGSSTMTVSTSSATPTGTYIITVTGTGGGITQTSQVWVTVTKAASLKTASVERDQVPRMD